VHADRRGVGGEGRGGAAGKPGGRVFEENRLEQLAGKFEEQFLNEMDDIPDLNEADLTQMGIVQIGLKKRLFKVCAFFFLQF
jgi:hypothetical protein